MMEKNPKASFELDCAHRLVTSQEKGSCTMEYESIIGYGKLELVPEEEKYAALCILMKHYHKEDFAFNKAVIPKTTVFKLTVDTCTGKRRKTGR